MAENSIDKGTYEVLRGRLNKLTEELQGKINALNDKRRALFGAVPTQLLSTSYIGTEHKCISRDIFVLGGKVLFGYNIHFGLKTSINLSDVFGSYIYREQQFVPREGCDLISDSVFIKEFEELYKYYKDTEFSHFLASGPFLYMIFRINEKETKAFKWKIVGESLEYIDNRSMHEVKKGFGYDFGWKKATRSSYRDGVHPHVSIEDKVFVETVGGDLTIKVEDNTDTGKGVYSEAVAEADQTLNDAEIWYSSMENCIFLKILPYKEKSYRYLVFNEKTKEVVRIDALGNTSMLLPDDYGVVFLFGYYLQTGTYKIFDIDPLGEMEYVRTEVAGNGEDYMYIFHQPYSGEYILFGYNVIEQKAKAPIVCNGYAFMPDGVLCYFKTEADAKVNHAVQIWQTPFAEETTGNPTDQKHGLLVKLGNKSIVKGIAACTGVIDLLEKEDSYDGLYEDIVKWVTSIKDTYYWLNTKDAGDIDGTLNKVQEVSLTAIQEYQKVVEIKSATNVQVQEINEKYEKVQKDAQFLQAENIDDYVKLLSTIREVRGSIVSAKELRYVDTELLLSLEESLVEVNEKVSGDCVQFLLNQDAYAFYFNKIKEIESGVEDAEKVVVLDEVKGQVSEVLKELEMLIDMVGNLKIADSTLTAQIINQISELLTSFHQISATIKRKRKSLQEVEGAAVFSAQMKLVNQSVANYIEVADTADKCNTYLTKLLIQLEQLEGRFGDSEEYIQEILGKRDEVYSVFESKKNQLVEQQNRKTARLQQSAERILSGIVSRLEQMEDETAIHGYMATDIMVDKYRGIVTELIDLGDTVKADSLVSKLKSTQTQALKTLYDKSALYEGGLIRFGTHKFSVNTQSLDVTIIPKDGEMYFHITGTDFFEKILDPEFLKTREVWNQSYVSENETVYRAEYLASSCFQKMVDAISLQEILDKKEDELLEIIHQEMKLRYNEGYVKGTHDMDALALVKKQINVVHHSGALRFQTLERVCGVYFWLFYFSEEEKERLNKQIKSAGKVVAIFQNYGVFSEVVENIERNVAMFVSESLMFVNADIKEVAAYLFYELVSDDRMHFSKYAYEHYLSFQGFLKQPENKKAFSSSIKELVSNQEKYLIICSWLTAYSQANKKAIPSEIIGEIALMELMEGFTKKQVIDVEMKSEIDGFLGEHRLIQQETYSFDYYDFSKRLKQFSTKTIPMYQKMGELKKHFIVDFKSEVKLKALLPKVMDAFVRNQLINEVYLPLIGANLAKQIGTSDTTKRTDLMGMLLLISPPGYGKTTLMEYIASSLGLIFLKINGPSIGREVTSLDPSSANNSASREELEKLNLGFEMGDNIMIYLDDIQHCDPEFLQKFISLCDAQRKIEGVYKGNAKTYDFKGKKVCVVMAGNPYTESGDKFQIPDMLANRSDIYNLGDIIGGNEGAFEMSYIENSLTSNPVLRKLSGKNQDDVYALVKMAELGGKQDVKGNYSSTEVDEMISVLKKAFIVRDIVLRVNMLYVKSAATEEQYRTEPPFRLQGSYRNMNKIVEQIVPVMDEEELKQLIMGAYVNESQTLTSNAEANLLRFKILAGWITTEEQDRWNAIIETYTKQQKLKGYGGDQTAVIVSQIEQLTDGLLGIKNVIEKK